MSSLVQIKKYYIYFIMNESSSYYFCFAEKVFLKTNDHPYGPIQAIATTID